MARVEPVPPSQWERWKQIRLRALLDEPDAFGSSHERELAYTETEWQRQLEQGAAWIAVDGVDVGIVVGGRRDAPDVRWVYSMWVAPSHRGTDVATELLTTVVQWAVGEGVPTLGLDVTDRVPRARRFYERFGFVARGASFPLPRDPSIVLTEMFLDLTTFTR